MRFRHTSHVGKLIKRQLIADMLFYVHTNLEHTLIGIVGYLLSMLHEIRSDNPHESLQLHLLISFHCLITGGIVTIRRMVVEILRT